MHVSWWSILIKVSPLLENTRRPQGLREYLDEVTPQIPEETEFFSKNHECAL